MNHQELRRKWCNCDVDYLCEYCNDNPDEELMEEMKRSYRMEFVPAAPDRRDLSPNELARWGM